MPNPDINLSPYTAESEAISRRMKMAELLQQQSMQPLETPGMAGGYQLRTSPYAGLAKILQGYTAMQAGKSAEAERKALGERARTQSAQEGREFASALLGTPGSTERVFDEAAAGGEGAFGDVTAPGVAPDRRRAMDMAMGSMNPTVQSAGGALMAQMFKPEKWDKIELPTRDGGKRVGVINVNAPNPISTFIEGGTQAPKLESSNLGGSVGFFNPYAPTNVPVANIPTTGTVDAALRRDMDMYQFGNLSANERESLAIKLRQLGIDVAKLNYDYRQGPAQQPPLPANAPVPNFGVQTRPQAMPSQPVAPVVQPAPRIVMAPRPVVPQPAPQAPAQPAAAAKPLIDTVTPRERQVLMVAQPQQTVSAQTALQNMERLSNVANELKNHPGLNSILGKLNQYSVLDMTDRAVNARALQSTLVKQSAVNALQAMRAASTTGGAVGNVTEKEWPILEQILAALDGAQTPTAYKAALTNLNNQLSSSSNRIRNAYEQTYGKLKYEATPYEEQGQEPTDAPLGAVRRIR